MDIMIGKTTSETKESDETRPSDERAPEPDPPEAAEPNASPLKRGLISGG